VLVARSKDKLDQLAAELGKKHGISARTIGKDLAAPSSPDEVFAEVQAASIQVDVLVNNAGYTMFGKFVENDAKEEADMMQVNIVTLTRLTKLFLPGMVERGDGKILNLGSTASFQSGPGMAVYYASKAYVLSLSEALADELKGTGVTVTALCPGPTRTGFQARARMEGARVLRLGVMDARTVARQGYRALMSGRALIITGRLNWLLAEGNRFMPRRVSTRMAGLSNVRDH
jgi:short-subunit dehydrogenase